MFEFLVTVGANNPTANYIQFYERYSEIRKKTIKDLSAFINAADLERETIKSGKKRYYDAQSALCIVDFMLTHRPCCRLVQTAWLIPAIAAGIPAIPLVAYA